TAPTAAPSASPPPAPFPPRPDEQARQQQLDLMKRRATGLLALAAVVLITAAYFEGQYPWLGYVRATAEASVVGGLADWFAVTALFRHPLGIPIPHTAIIGRQKDRIGRIIGNFVQHHFLSREAVTAKLRGMGLARRAAEWIGDPANAQRIAVQVAAGVARTLEALPDDKIRELIQRGARDRIRATRVAPMIGRTLAVVVAGDRHQELLNEVIRLAAGAVRGNQELIRQRVRSESPWWVPSAIDNKIYHRIVLAIEQLLNDISHDPSHPIRGAFDKALRDFVDRLQHSPEAGARAEALKEEWFSDDAVAEFSAWAWDATRNAVTGYAMRPETGEPGPLVAGISAFGKTLLDNEKLLDDIDDMAIQLLVGVIETHRHEVADLIAQTVARWDPDVTSQRLELAVGRDLQFVRINGTLVGGLVGLLIYAVPRLFR
ncbi:MAG: DUF445 domain-containing protein, partial [Gemmatimonadales bacterium]|nr:DUF445 domain-containing protein [Gemmatimonadales bacterium]